MGTLRRYFVAGLLVWIPLGITLWVLKLLVDVMDQSLLLLPEKLRSDALFGFHVPGLGIILTLAIVLATGALAANFFGRKILDIGESLGHSDRAFIYGGVKRISDTLFRPRARPSASGAGALSAPGRGPGALGPQRPARGRRHLGREHISGFFPTAPNIAAGFFLGVPRAARPSSR
jgi:uncharacterized membrane protein